MSLYGYDEWKLDDGCDDLGESEGLDDEFWAYVDRVVDERRDDSLWEE